MRQLHFAIVIALVALVGNARGERAVLSENPGHATFAVVTVDASPSEIYRLATDYVAWPRVFTDASDVQLVHGGARDARVKFKSKALEHVVEIQFDNVPDRLIRFRAVHSPPGAKAAGVYELVPLDGGKRTRVVARVVLHVGGMASMLASPTTVTRMRRAKVQSDLDDLVRHFSHG